MSSSCAETVETVHPRVCGERGILAAEKADEDGSSPRMRGTPFGTIMSSEYIRFIPAYAGNAEVLEVIDDEEPVHPRVCGERGVASARLRA